MTEALNGLPSIFVVEIAATATSIADPKRVGLPANKIRGIISASCSLVHRHRRIRAQRARADDLPLDRFRGGNRRRCGPGLDPFINGGDHVERARAVSAAAM